MLDCWIRPGPRMVARVGACSRDSPWAFQAQGDTGSGNTAMARQCEICGKQSQMGNQVTIRGKRKYLGGVGTKITGITRRKFRPNLQRVKVNGEDGRNKHLLVCTSCIRSGGVKKVVRQAPFTVPTA